MKMVTAISLAVNTLCRYKSHEVAARRSGEDSRRSGTNGLHIWHNFCPVRSDFQRHGAAHSDTSYSFSCQHLEK